MKKWIYIWMAWAAWLLLPGCSDEEAWQGNHPADADGNVTMQFSATLPDPVQVATRAGEIDQFDMETVYLYCFGESGTFIGRSSAKFSITEGGSAEESYQFSAKVPYQTRTIHFVANWNDLNFKPSDHIAETEEQVMLGMQSYSGKLGYWGRVSVTPDVRVETNVTFIRNQAKVTVEKEEGVSFTITGFSVYNAYDRGTVAPFDETSASFVTNAGNIADCTLPQEYGKATNATEPGELTMAPVYLFENPNADNDPVYAIISGHHEDGTDRFYKVMFQRDSESLKILRNHHYRIILKSNPRSDLGQVTIADAMRPTAPALNNVWIAVSNEVTKISDAEHTLDIEKAVRVFQKLEGGKATFNFHYYNSVKGTYTEGTDPTPVVKWADPESAEMGELTHEIGPDGNATVTLTLRKDFAITEELQRASIQIKAGVLSRIVKVLFVEAFQFTPVWASTNVPGDKEGQNVNFAFNIPDNFPDELLPLECYISANELDPRDENLLNILIKDDDTADTWGENFPKQEDLDLDIPGYEQLPGAAEKWEHKFIYLAERKGVQRVYFKTSLALSGDTEKGVGHIYVEAENFEYVHQAYTLNSHAQTAYEFDETDGWIYSYNDPNAENPSEHPIKYMLMRPVTGFSYDLPFASPEAGIVRVFTEKADVLSCNDTSTGSVEEDKASGARFYTVTVKEGENILKMKTRSSDPTGIIRLGSVGGNVRSAALTVDPFRPFDFREFKVNGNPLSNNHSVSLDYKPGSEVALQFKIGEEHRDATGALSGKDSVDVVIDPFSGGEFNCFLQTTNLTLVDADGNEVESYTDNTGGIWSKTNGGYTYLVKSSSEIAREVKFKTTKIVSAETIRLTSDQDKVRFNPVEFSLKNSSQPGKATYGENNEGVPAGNTLVIYARGNAIIGSLIVTQTGNYTLRLNPGYTDQLAWDENVLVTYELHDSAGTTYYWVGPLHELDGGTIHLTKYVSGQ